jgi:hypothetical protein
MLSDERPDDVCPLCGFEGCYGECRDPEHIDPTPESHDRIWLCVICGENWVDSRNGYDTCADCLRKM